MRNKRRSIRIFKEHLAKVIEIGGGGGGGGRGVSETHNAGVHIWPLRMSWFDDEELHRSRGWL